MSIDGPPRDANCFPSGGGAAAKFADEALT